MPHHIKSSFRNGQRDLSRHGFDSQPAPSDSRVADRSTAIFKHFWDPLTTTFFSFVILISCNSILVLVASFTRLVRVEGNSPSSSPTLRPFNLNLQIILFNITTFFYFHLFLVRDNAIIYIWARSRDPHQCMGFEAQIVLNMSDPLIGSPT